MRSNAWIILGPSALSQLVFRVASFAGTRVFRTLASAATEVLAERQDQGLLSESPPAPTDT